MKLLVFDIDGTLTSTNSIDTECFVAALESFFEFDDFDRNWKNYRNVTDSGVSEEIANRYWERSLSRNELAWLEKIFMQRLELCPSSAFRPIAGAVEFIEYLRKSSGYAMALATGCWRSSAIHKLNQAGIDHARIPLASSSYSPERVEIMQHAEALALAEWKVSGFDEILYFGDAVWDVIASKKLGWRMIGIGDDIRDLRDLGVENTFTDYRQIHHVVRAIEAQQVGESNMD